MHRRKRFWVEIVLVLLTASLALVTILWPDWIELLLKIEPDAGNGLVEVAITFGAAIASVGFALLARTEWRASPAPAAR